MLLCMTDLTVLFATDIFVYKCNDYNLIPAKAEVYTGTPCDALAISMDSQAWRMDIGAVLWAYVAREGLCVFFYIMSYDLL